MPATELAPLHVALLRGINVSGKNMLPMAELASIFVEAGCEDVRTYIQSGNAVFLRLEARNHEHASELEDGVTAGGDAGRLRGFIASLLSFSRRRGDRPCPWRPPALQGHRQSPR
ncbi:MAG: hypothetical protein DRH23_02345 [Deltaproteobacteria bacterium]|nr:DUF1697 domain-containing protein [Deltaproteobacteria bacterium]MBW2189324.1 DUF1697 domain-containing protein [Deltaproteobacteria bacterium]MBW2223150.1 DUF1697 domain-containing protein [Deltaproteobacteria bacterium]MBW2402826.1 DUF1697 domain-containing protein [Deltaproteobacteria bacterium]MBW2546591.1 DUF1697 domain-containing protein [Deltaproteobacteria bacterium]